MSFLIVTDSSANLPMNLLKQYQLTVVPLSYYVDDQEYTCVDLSAFDGTGFYQMLRGKTTVKTSLINVQRFMDALHPLLEQGNDLLYVGMSSGISGSFQSALAALDQLREQYRQRLILAVDTLAASLGEGLQVIKAAKLREAGKTITETAQALVAQRQQMNQVFTVDDLMFLKRGGRLSSMGAVLGTVLHIKPLLRGDEEGKIVVFAKERGRKAALKAMAAEFERKVVHPNGQLIGIAHGGCLEDADYLASLIMERYPAARFLIEIYEPVTGSHVGPGAVALFFEGEDRR